MFFSCCALWSQPTDKGIFAPKLHARENTCESIELIISNINKHLIREIRWLKNDSILVGRSMEGKQLLFGGKNGEGSDDAHFRFPSSAVVHKDQLYIADLFNHRIQTWELKGTKASTLIGNTNDNWSDPELNYPSDVFIDSKGQLYIADQENNRIVLFDSKTKSLITVAGGNGRGSSAKQLKSPSAVFVHEKTGNIYVADTYNQRIQKWEPGSKNGITVAGGNGLGSHHNQLKNPSGIFVDEDENIFIADAGNDRIQLWKKDADFGITVAGGNGRGNRNDQLRDPKGVFVNDAGDIYIADFCNHRIQLWPKENDYGITIAGNGVDTTDSLLLNYPKYLFISNENGLFITDQHNHRIVQKELLTDKALVQEVKTPGSYRARILLKNGVELQTNTVIIDSSQLTQKTQELLKEVSQKINTKITMGDSIVCVNQPTSIKWLVKDDLLKMNERNIPVAQKAGIAKVTLLAENNYGCSFSRTVSVTIIPPPPVTRDTSFTYDLIVTKQILLDQISGLPNAEILLFKDAGTTDTIKNFEPFTNQVKKFWVKQFINGQISESSNFKIEFLPRRLDFKLPFGKKVIQSRTVAIQQVYPNPSAHYFSLVFNIPVSEILKIRIHTITGQEIENIQPNESVIRFGHHYLPGNYVVTIIHKKGQQSLQLIKTK